MKYSIFSWFGYFQPLGERLDVIKEAGFDEVMLSWEDETAPVHIPKEAMPDIVREKGLGITNLHAPFAGYNDIWEKDAEGSRELLNTFVGYVRDCQRFDIPALVVHTNDLDLGDYRRENGIRFFQALGEAGEKYGVNIAVENVSRQYLLDVVLSSIKLPHLGMCYDTSHDYLLNCGRGRLLKKYGDRIKALHISDNDLNLDRHWVPGEGYIPFDIIVPQLQALGIETFSFEVNANRAWRQCESLEFATAVRHSLDAFVQ